MTSTEWIDKDWTENDYTENATYFLPHEASDRARFKRLVGWNAGTHRGKWENTTVTYPADDLRQLDAIASQLELTTLRHEEAREIFTSLELGTLGFSSELVAFCVCAHAVKRDGREFVPTRKGGMKDFQFRQFATQQQYDWNLLVACYKAIRSPVGAYYA